VGGYLRIEMGGHRHARRSGDGGGSEPIKHNFTRAAELTG